MPTRGSEQTMSDKIKCILLVDDDQDSNHLHKFIIGQSFPVEQVHLAENGKEALDFLQSDHEDHLKPDLIFLDI
jgi:CheY-like chemotaxis protein